MTAITDEEMTTYSSICAEMETLRALDLLTAEQADRWASLAGTRLALYTERDYSWQAKACPRADGTWRLLPMTASDSDRPAAPGMGVEGCPEGEAE